MNIQIDETLSVSFNTWDLETANKRLEELKQKHPDRFDDVCNGLLTLLLFRQLELSNPGTMTRLIEGMSLAKKGAA